MELETCLCFLDLGQAEPIVAAAVIGVVVVVVGPLELVVQKAGEHCQLVEEIGVVVVGLLVLRSVDLDQTGLPAGSEYILEAEDLPAAEILHFVLAQTDSH